MDGLQDRDWKTKVLYTLREIQVHDHLNIYKMMGPDELHPTVTREFADIVAKPLSMILEKSWQTGKVPGDWKRGNILPIFKKDRKKDPGNNQLVSIISLPGKIMEQNTPRSCAEAHGGQGGDSEQPASKSSPA